MNKLSSKIKIVIVVVLFVLFSMGMFVYGYDILQTRNQAIADAAGQHQLELETLEREQRSFEQGQKDLASLSSKQYPPIDLFSKDTKVVKEIKVLEETAERYGIEFSLSIAGNTKSAVKAVGTKSEIFIIPYTATLDGAFDNVMKYLQEIEHLPFVTQTKSFNISAQESGNIRALLSSEFYIKK
ncbi:MAG: hypothetical protein M3Q64_00565 [bacterium]|nr:hypothetical protein [bacterium]